MKKIEREKAKKRARSIGWLAMCEHEKQINLFKLSVFNFIWSHCYATRCFALVIHRVSSRYWRNNETTIVFDGSLTHNVYKVENVRDKRNESERDAMELDANVCGGQFNRFMGRIGNESRRGMPWFMLKQKLWNWKNQHVTMRNILSRAHLMMVSFHSIEIRTVRTLYIRKTKASFTAEAKKRRIHCVEQFTKFAHIASIQSGQKKKKRKKNKWKKVKNTGEKNKTK